MISATARTCLFTIAGIAAAISLVGSATGQDDLRRNAIFNGDFLEGRAGWVIGGPDDLEVRTHRTMIADRADAELSLRHPGLEQTVGVYSQYPIGVKPGREYTLSLTAAGEGTIAFGVYEYNEAGRNTIFPLSEPIALRAEPVTYTFTYTASDLADTIRPRIQVIGSTPLPNEPATQPAGGPAGATHVRLLRFELMLSQEDFASSTQWPEWAVSGDFTSYQGLSADEIRTIREAVAVDRVLPPYEPIRRAGRGAFALTTSEFEFGRSVLPQQISVLGEPILTRPIELALEVGDEPPVALRAGGTNFSATEQRVVARQGTRGEGWRLGVTSTLEYDALLICDLVLRAEEPVTIMTGTLALPLTSQVARHIRYHKDTGDKTSIFGEGPIPATGETVEVLHTFGRNRIKNDWSPVAPAPEQGVLWEWKRGVPWHFWLGDERRGIGWIVESEQGWSVADDDVTLALERTVDGVEARVSFITEPVTVKGEWRMRFILQAMPPKPVRPDWFKLRFSRFWNWAPGDLKMIERIEAARTDAPPTLQELPPSHVLYAHAGSGEGEMRPPWAALAYRRPKDLGILNWEFWSVGCGSPQVGDPEALRRYLAAGSYVGHRALPYLAPTHLSVNDLNGYYYAAKTDAWSKIPTVGETSYYVKVCPNSFASEYQAYEIGRLIDEYGIEGIYFDNTHPSGCMNTAHGCGWVDADGQAHPTTPILGMRRLFMMVREQFLKRGREPFIFKHAGALPGAISFVDANLDGEGVYGYDHTQMFTTGEFRARWIGPTQFGLIEVYLPQFSTGTDTTEVTGAQQVILGTPRLMALALVHGTPIYCGAINGPPMFKAWTVLDELQGDTVEFIPYWAWAFNEGITPRGLYATLYHQQENSVLAVANLSANDQAIVIPRGELDPLVPGLERAEDHMHGWKVDLDAESLRMSVPAKNFRLISLR